jgi:hypothetical protein
LNRSEVSANVTFLAKLSNKEIYKKKKVAVKMGLINVIACLIGDVLSPLYCCNVIVGNSYKVFTRQIHNDLNT